MEQMPIINAASSELQMHRLVSLAALLIKARELREREACSRQGSVAR